MHTHARTLHKHTHTHASTHTHTHIHPQTHTHTHKLHKYPHAHTHTQKHDRNMLEIIQKACLGRCARLFTCLFMCMHVGMCVRMYVCVYVRACVPTHVLMRTCARQENQNPQIQSLCVTIRVMKGQRQFRKRQRTGWRRLIGSLIFTGHFPQK